MKYIQATVSTTVKGLADIYPSPPTRLATAVITVRSGALNIVWDGSDPTTALGMKLTTTSQPLILRNMDIDRMRMIRDAGVDAVIDVMFA
jgi:hypothetical protein